MKSKKIFPIVLVSFLLLQILDHDISFAQAKKSETEVREALAKFKKGIDDRDSKIGEQLAAKGNSSFVDFYNSFVSAYRQAKMVFPMEIGHVKILKDGRAKAETYLNPDRNMFVFTLKKEEGEWKICHTEGIRFPVYEIPKLPYEDIYQLPAQKRSWAIAEIEMAFKSRVFYQLKQDHGEEFARNFFLDGMGFRVGMDTWLPFIEGAAQFAIYCAILETNFYGSKCIVTKASYDEAEIHFTPLTRLQVLQRASFNPKFEFEEYIKLFSAIMRDRARCCGLEVKISFNKSNCILKLNRIQKDKTPGNVK